METQKVSWAMKGSWRDHNRQSFGSELGGTDDFVALFFLSLSHLVRICSQEIVDFSSLSEFLDRLGVSEKAESYISSGFVKIRITAGDSSHVVRQPGTD
ncbi:hypothetical protein SDJN03_07428, partial [Cucurbita argyrosperma subsp. sororia]